MTLQRIVEAECGGSADDPYRPFAPMSPVCTDNMRPLSLANRGADTPRQPVMATPEIDAEAVASKYFGKAGDHTARVAVLLIKNLWKWEGILKGDWVGV